jgi:hypothetical protein
VGVQRHNPFAKADEQLILKPFPQGGFALRVRQLFNLLANLANGNDAQIQARFFDAIYPFDDFRIGLFCN